MSWRSLIYTRLTGVAALTALISTRVYAMVLPQNATYPAIVFHVIDDEEHWHAWGKTRIQLNCYAASYAGALAVRDAVRDALNQWGAADAAVRVEDCETNGPGFEDHDPDTGIYCVGMDALLVYVRK